MLKEDVSESIQLHLPVICHQMCQLNVLVLVNSISDHSNHMHQTPYFYFYFFS